LIVEDCVIVGMRQDAAHELIIYNGWMTKEREDEVSFQGFTAEDFETFHIEGLEGRMEAIRSRIQPKFRAISEQLIEELSLHTGDELFLHIAKHARRTVNAPVDTWMAFSSSKRGYKQLPHFQIGLFDDRVFIWFAAIYELPNKKEIAQALLDHAEQIRSMPTDFMLSFDHMKKDADALSRMSEEELETALRRFRDVKKAEFLIGRNLDKHDPVLQDGARFLQLAKETLLATMPLYKLAQLG
jgi:uncharacterized protein YktB (UPF0637 family)